MQNPLLEEICSEDVVKSVMDILESDDEDEDHQPEGGSRPGCAANIDRDRLAGAVRLYDDYFSPTPVYSDDLFRHRFRLCRCFGRIYEALTTNPYFIQRRDYTGLLGLSGYQKDMAAIRVLA